MFVMALTLGDRGSVPGGLRGTTVACGGGHAMVAINDLLGVMRVSEGAAEVGESLPARSGSSRYWLVRARLDLQTGEGTVRRRMNSGRHVYYVERFGEVFIASHVKLLRELGVPIEENDRKLPELFQYRYAMPGATLLKGVRQLQADEEITIKRGPRGWSVQTTGIFSPPEPDAAAAGDLVAECRDALESVHDEANLDESRFATLLSGGLDSSILTRIASRRMGLKRSWSCAYPFEDASDDIEYTYATTAAASMGLSHEVHVPTMAEYLRGLVESIWHAEQPVIHLQTVLLYCIFRDRLAPGGIDVVSCGEGADGMFGFRFHQFLQHFLRHPAQRFGLGLPPVRWQLRLAARTLNRFGLVAEMAGRKFDPRTPLEDPDHILWSLAMFGDEAWIRRTFGCTRREITQGRAEAMRAYAGRSLLDAVSILGFLSEGTETQVVWSLVGEGCAV